MKKRIRNKLTADLINALDVDDDEQPVESCPCCGDTGSDGAKNWKSGHCQKCRRAGCPKRKSCVRPPAHQPFYDPEESPQGWGSY